MQHAELLERWLMEGAYNKVLAARDSMPDPAYAYFMQRLLNTVRCEPMDMLASTSQAPWSCGASQILRGCFRRCGVRSGSSMRW